MILQIVAPLVASVGAAAKSKTCVSARWLPHFPWPVADAIFPRGETGYRLHLAMMANSIFLWG